MDHDPIYAIRSQRTFDALSRVFRPFIWNTPLGIVIVATVMITQPTVHDNVPLVIIGLCFPGMIIFTTIGTSRVRAVRRSAQLDKENLTKGLRPDGEPL